MKIAIDTTIFNNEDITATDFAILLYYILGGKGILNPTICNTLWEKSYLYKEEDGYSWNKNLNSKLNDWINMSLLSKEIQDNNITLAKQLQELFPKGIKENTIYHWRDSTRIIALRLSTFFNKFGNYSNDDILNATKRYIDSFNGNTTYMQVLKHFILKKDKTTGEYSSMLASYLENEEDIPQNWQTTIV